MTFFYCLKQFLEHGQHSVTAQRYVNNQEVELAQETVKMQQYQKHSLVWGTLVQVVS